MKVFMNHLLTSIFLISFLFLCGCTVHEEIRQNNNDCPKYVKLNYSDYNSLEQDPITSLSAKVEGDFLKLSLQYGGGCQEHQVDLALILPECGTPPLPPPTFEIRHNANRDACKALITKDYCFNISEIKETGKDKIDFTISGKNVSGVTVNTTYTYSY